MNYQITSLADNIVTAAKIQEDAVLRSKLKLTRLDTVKAVATSGISTLTSVLTLDLGTLVEGDLAIVMYTVSVLKGASQGLGGTRLMRSSGTGVITWGNNLTVIDYQWHQEASQQLGIAQVQIGEVTTAGTYVLDLRVQSNGSDSEVDSGNARFGVLLLHNE